MKRFLLMLTGALVSLSMLSGGAQAGLRYFGVEDSIMPDMSVHHQVKLEFDVPVDGFEYSLDSPIKNLTTKNNFGSSECTAEPSGTGSVISCIFDGMKPDKSFVTMDFESDGKVMRTGQNYMYGSEYEVPMPVSSLFNLVRLPENGIFASQVVNESYSPSDGRVITDGRNIMVYWERQNVTARQSVQVSVSYNLPSSEEPFYNFTIGAMVFILLATLFGVAVFFRRTHADGDGEAMRSVLNSNEKAVIDVLVKHGGNAVQKALVRETDFSKAKVSRLVRSLQDRGLIRVEPVSGRENRVMLTLEKKG
jgi:hypothetical protein